VFRFQSPQVSPLQGSSSSLMEHDFTTDDCVVAAEGLFEIIVVYICWKHLEVHKSLPGFRIKRLVAYTCEPSPEFDCPWIDGDTGDGTKFVESP
jgi:hypothetical protein